MATHTPHSPVPHDWMIFTPEALPPTPTALLGQLRAKGLAAAFEPELAPAAPDEPAWDTLGLRLGPRDPVLVVEVERAAGPEAWLVGAELERAAAALRDLPPGPGRREALRRLQGVRLLLGLHLIPAPTPASPAWQAAASVAAALADAPGRLAWQPGGGFRLDGVSAEDWPPPAQA